MQSNLEKAKTVEQKLLALEEIHHFLSQAISCECRSDIHLNELARAGLANLFFLLAEECQYVIDVLRDSHE